MNYTNEDFKDMIVNNISWLSKDDNFGWSSEEMVLYIVNELSYSEMTLLEDDLLTWSRVKRESVILF